MTSTRASICGLLALGLTAAGSPAFANPFLIKAAPAAFTTTFAARYWYGMGSTSKDLYNGDGSLLVSRLDYGELRTHTAEGYFRIDHNSSLFVKGYAGGGFLTSGNLVDEDFPPITVPYSSTMSTQPNRQSLAYASADIGGAIFRGADFRIDAFVGYHYLNENMQAYGCRQIGSNPGICGTAIPDSVPVIGQENTWQSLRLGLAADIPLYDRFRLSIEGAWLPYVWMSGADSHYLRIGTGFGSFTGPIPEDGTGWGYQFEAVLSYRIDENFDLAVGGRYWHMQSRGYTHFENRVVGVAAGPQVLDWKTDHYGVFLQGSYKFSML